MAKKILTEKDFYLQLLEQVTAEIAKTNVDIEVYNAVPTDEVIGKGMDGNDMKASEALEVKKKNLEVYEMKRAAINRLLDK